MPPSESEAAAFATTSEADFYDILGIPVDAITESALRKAFRKQSLKWHPDKNPSTEAAEKFHLLTTAYDVLSDLATKQAYDNARAARLAKKRRSAAFDINRRRMQEDLESRENRTKRPRTDPESEFEAAFAKLQEEGAKLRQKREEALRAAAKEAQEAQVVPEQGRNTKEAKSRFSELDRTISVRWRRKGEGEKIDQVILQKMFGRFGKIQDCIVKSSEKEKKLRNGLIVFESIVSAHAAVRDALSTKDAEFGALKVVTWASGKEPDLSGLASESGLSSTPASPIPGNMPTPGAWELPRSPRRAAWVPPVSTPKDRLKRVPSFASFTTPIGTNPRNSPFSKSEIAQSPDYESITLMRMRDAEKRRLEAEIRKKEEEASTEDTV